MREAISESNLDRKSVQSIRMAVLTNSVSVKSLARFTGSSDIFQFLAAISVYIVNRDY